jgi:hypothetical protein
MGFGYSVTWPPGFAAVAGSYGNSIVGRNGVKVCRCCAASAMDDGMRVRADCWKKLQRRVWLEKAEKKIGPASRQRDAGRAKARGVFGLER